MSRHLPVPIPPPDDLEDMVREHGSWTAVARVLGASLSGVTEAARKAGIASPALRGGPRRCAICRIGSDEGTILRLALTKYRAGTAQRRRAGSILLCETCWRAASSEARVTRARQLHLDRLRAA